MIREYQSIFGIAVLCSLELVHYSDTIITKYTNIEAESGGVTLHWLDFSMNPWDNLTEKNKKITAIIEIYLVYYLYPFTCNPPSFIVECIYS